MQPQLVFIVRQGRQPLSEGTNVPSSAALTLVVAPFGVLHALTKRLVTRSEYTCAARQCTHGLLWLADRLRLTPENGIDRTYGGIVFICWRAKDKAVTLHQKKEQNRRIRTK